MDRDLYADLGVAPTASPAELGAAWRRACAAHPDLGGDPRKFADAAAAYHFLKDPANRAAYDRARAVAEVARNTRPKSMEWLRDCLRHEVERRWSAVQGDLARRWDELTRAEPGQLVADIVAVRDAETPTDAVTGILKLVGHGRRIAALLRRPKI